MSLGVAIAGDSNSRLITYQNDGESLFALSLLPNTQADTATRKLAIAIVVDTSASQSGSYRSDSIELAKRVLESLPEQSTASLLSCDIEPTILGVGEPRSQEMVEGLGKLGKIVPLGTSDIVAALKVARDSLGSSQDAVILYIGDGLHRCNLLEPKGFENLIGKLKEGRVTVNSLAIGPEIDAEFLATIANHTGGVVYVHKNIENASNQQIGAKLANACISPVFWPNEVNLPEGVAASYPKDFPPLRWDRDSIVVGKLARADVAGTLKVRGVVNGKNANLAWELKNDGNHEDLAFLSEVVEKAQLDGGLTLPTPGSDAFLALGHMLMNSSESLVKDARYALHIGDREAAIAIAKEALRRSPNNLSARNILDAAEKSAKPVKAPSASPKIVKFISAQQGDDPFGAPPEPPKNAPATQEPDPFGDDPSPKTVPAPTASAPSTPAPPAATPGTFAGDTNAANNLGSSSPAYDELANAGDLLAEDDAVRRVAAQQLEAQVKSDVASARRAGMPGSAATDFSAVKLSLKSLLDQVRRAPELDAGSRVRLERMVVDAIQRTAATEARQREDLARQEAVRSAQSATQRLLADSERRQETIKQLVERYDSLMRQQLFAAANSEVAPQISAIDRGSVIDVVTNIESNIAANEKLISDVIRRRNHAFVDSLYLNEEALVPFVDEPPIRYPPADVWQALSNRRLERYGSIDLSGGNAKERKIYSALDKPVDADFNGTPLSTLMKTYGEDLGIPIVMDDRALEEENIAPDEQISLSLPPQSVSFRSALKLILDPLELTYVIEDEVMRITTKKGSADVVRVYPVGDLVVPVMPMGGGMMGGMGGMGMGGMGMGGMGMGGMGMGGMGGGMGGMGMGGMGGGMGGMGMGGGMGGMFDVPDTARKAAARDPWTIVKEVASDDSQTKLKAESELSDWVSSKMKLAKKASDSKNMPEASKHFQDIIDVISEAMRQSLPSSWMFDALCTSMQANDYPANSIRRVLLSSIDYGGDEESAMKIAKYLNGADLKKEALMVLRDIHRVNPTHADALELALKLAIDIEDTDAMRWASTGILSQGWPDEKVDLIEKALLTARACYVRMTENKEVTSAYAFSQELKDAQSRDLIIRVVWTGDADLDISVEEPTGTICENRTQRSSSGGLLLGDRSSLTKADKDGFSETYVCAKGYSGSYKVVIKKIWGDVAGGKVTVNILSDYNTPDQKVIQQVIPLGPETDAVAVLAHVKNGHRKEPIADALLARVQSSKAAMGSAVLAQQAGGGQGSGQTGSTGSSDSGWTMEMWQAYMASRFGNVNNNRPPLFGRGGAVGYSPQITVIPAGTQMGTMAVISGDRRYVRVAPSPMFSDIVAVDTFNFANGDSTTQGGGGLGGGGAGGLGGGGGAGGGGFGGGVF
jgi:hypothetical protein